MILYYVLKRGEGQNRQRLTDGYWRGGSGRWREGVEVAKTIEVSSREIWRWLELTFKNVGATELFHHNARNHCTSLTVIRGRGNCPARKRLKLVSVTGLNLLERVRKLCSSTVFMISSGHLHITPLLTPLWLSPPQRWHWRSALDVNDEGERGAVVPVVNGEETL